MLCILLILLYIPAGYIKAFCIPFIRQLMSDSFCLGRLGQRCKKFITDVSAVAGFLKMEFCRNPFSPLMITCRILGFYFLFMILRKCFLVC